MLVGLKYKMADQLCVGDANCSFKMVINAMKKAPTFEDIVDHWRKITLDLEVGENVVKKIQRQILYEDWSALEVMNEILRSWRLSKATDAKLTVLLDTLKDLNLMDVLLEVRKKFYPNTDKSNQQVSSQLEPGADLQKPINLPQLSPGKVTKVPIEYAYQVVNQNNDDVSSWNQALYSITEDDLMARALKDPKFTNVVVKIEKQTKRKVDFYKLPGIQNGNGYALILNIIRYKHGEYRCGAQYDSLMLTQLFTQLGYEVIKYDDPNFFYTKNYIKKIVEIFRDYIKAKTPASVIVYVGCHGQMEQIVLSDKTVISLFTSVVYQFDAKNCPSLKNVPKIFISSSCRDIPTYNGPGFSNIFNTIICYATLPGNKAYRDIFCGSYYIQSLVKVFAENAHRLNLIELLEQTQQDLWSREILDKPGIKLKQQCMYVILGGFGTLYFNVAKRKRTTYLPNSNLISSKNLRSFKKSRRTEVSEMTNHPKESGVTYYKI